jgi:hypothetical protein
MGSSSAESRHSKTIYFGLSALNSFSDARNTSISLDKTLPNDSFRQNATLATVRVLASKKYVAKLVERVLADHKDVLRNPAAASAIGEMLDTFVTAGWPAAMTLTLRLDEAVR